MKSAFDLRSERGSSIVEFLVCAPILALLSYGAYDLNRRIENQQTVTIAARNALLMGNAFSDSQQKDTIKKQLNVSGQVLDAKEVSEVLSNIYVSVEGDQHLNNQIAASRIAATSSFNTSGGTSPGSSFDTFSRNTGDIGKKLAEWLQSMQNTGESVNILIPDGIRTAGVETRASGDSNAMQSAIGVLARATTNNDRAGRQVLDVERRFGQRFYLRQESGYHPNKHTGFDYPGIFMGAARADWGGDTEFGDDSNHIQGRCMTRLYGSDACGGNGQHEFHDHVKTTASAKMVVSGILHVLQEIPWTSAFATAAMEVMDAATGAALTAAKVACDGVGAVAQASSLFDKGASGASGLVSQISTSSIDLDFPNSLNPVSLQKKIGE